MNIFDFNNMPEESNNRKEKPLIMLVDDEEHNLKVLTHELECKYKIITATNGLEARLSKYNHFQPIYRLYFWLF